MSDSEENAKAKPSDKEKKDKKDDSSVNELTAAIEKVQIQPSVKKPVHKDLIQIATWIQSGACKRILTVCGAGISVSAGIPDFRTPGTGLYDNLQKYKLPYAEAIFDVDFYARQPEPFLTLAAQLWPGLIHTPTLTHSFLSLLAHKGLLLRNYTQNIDGLEYLAGLPAEQLVECHGHFRTASCIACSTQADMGAVKTHILETNATTTKKTPPLCKKCKSFCKPDIVFFGEGLPKRFFELLQTDTHQADLVLVLGTSLQVAPVNSIPDRVSCQKRGLLNMQRVGSFGRRKQDAVVLGPCDDSVQQLADLLGWTEELHKRHKAAVEAIQSNKNRSGESNKEKA